MGPYTYRIELDETLRERAQDLGQQNASNQTILLATDQGPDQLASTLVHELLHALFALVGLDKEFNDDQEEAVCRRMEAPLLALLRQNPSLVTYLTDD